jgi:hypothetical protein
MAAPSPHGSSAEDSTLFWLLFVAALYLGGSAALRYFEPETNFALGTLRYAQLYPFAYLGELIDRTTWLTWLKDGWFDQVLFAPAQKAVTWLETNPFSRMGAEQRDALATIAGRCLAALYLPMLLVLGSLLRNLRPDITYRGTQTLESMIWQSSDYWLASRQARHINPLELEGAEAAPPGPMPASEASTPPHLARCHHEPTGPAATESYLPLPPPTPLGAWSPALKPEEWLAGAGVTADPETKRFLPDDLRSCFHSQLGAPWTSFADLPLPARAIAAACAYYYAGRVQEGVDLLDDLALVFDVAGRRLGMAAAIRRDRAVLARIEAALHSPAAAALERIAAQHAFVPTALVRVLIESRASRGVLASASFLWLKAEDRRLWYVLNNAGGNAYHVECAAAMSHYKAELQMQRPIHAPVVRYAVVALELDYLDLAPARQAKREQRQPKPTPGALLRDVAQQIAAIDPNS